MAAGSLPLCSLYEYCFDAAAGCWRSWKSQVRRGHRGQPFLFSLCWFDRCQPCICTVTVAVCYPTPFKFTRGRVLLIDHFRSQVGPYCPPPDGAFSKILVPTADIVRSTWLLKTVAGGGRPCLFVGDSGTAKSVTIAAFLAALDGARWTSAGLGFSSRTSSMDVQRAIEDCVEKRTKVGRVRVSAIKAVLWPPDLEEGRQPGEAEWLQTGERTSILQVTNTNKHALLKIHQDTFGPPLGKRLVLFIDDLNMPRLDAYGTQQPVALLRQVVERRGMYDRGKELGWKNLKDVQVGGCVLVCVCGVFVCVCRLGRVM